MAQKLYAYLSEGTAIPGPPGLPRVIHDEGVPLPVRTVIDMVGPGVTATDDEAGDRTIITIPGGTADMVVSVFGRPGPAITAQAGDYSAAQVTNAVSVLGSYSDPSWITSLSWGKIEGEPSSFPPSAHTHDWGEITGEPASFPPSAHTHPWSEVTGKPLVFPPEAHQHPWGDLTGVPSNVSAAVPNTTQIIAGTGLTGGGALSGNVTLSANIAGIQTPWLQDIEGAGYALNYPKQVNIRANPPDTAGTDSITGLSLDRTFTSAGDSMDIVWGTTDQPAKRAGRIACSATSSGEMALIFYAQTGGGDGYTNEILRMRGDGVINCRDLFIENSSPVTGATMRFDGYADYLHMFTAGPGGGGVRLGTSDATRIEIRPDGTILMFLGGALKTLSVDGSGFVKAT